MNTIKAEQETNICIADILIIIYISLVCLNRNFPIDASSVWKYGVFFIIYIFLRSFPPKNRIWLWVILFGGLAESFIAISQQLYLLESRNDFFRVTGTFDNPGQLGGFLAICLTISIGLACLYFKKHYYYPGILLSAFSVIILYTLLLSDSRSGWLAVTSGSLYIIISQYTKIKIFTKVSSWQAYILKGILLLPIIVFLTGIYLHKKASADGRLLIWQVTINMIYDKPLLGHGTGGWQAHYMNYQATYFQQHPGSPYIMLADNVAYPYNEFLQITSEQGLLGLCVVLALLYSLLVYRIEDDATSALMKACLVAFGIFACFSYPSDIFLMILMLAILLSTLKSKAIIHLSIKKPIQRGYLFLFILIIGSLSLWSYQLCRECQMRMYELLYTRSNTKNIQSYLDNHYSVFKFNTSIMDIYAQYSFQNYPLEKADIILQDAARIAPFCELLCNIGELYEKKENYIQAERHYQQAANMIPSRIMPKYKLFQLYLKQSSTISLYKTAYKILNQPIKIEGTQALKIKAIIRKYIQQSRQPHLSKETYH